ncbi:DUF4252 domain-containing protein [Yeosuana sp. MJ-SS3]|uniref:DUF4252 domain-containing protein n=1 Tax=Gilvirhabdus luticola TaxID=3079858 RepID=A0ABU3U7P8_9FLAO|nr:DUF4252 domain-containing protein [Yeosuana sp. MJ-SS3]MDU8886416.1 DUF4252 domain-containing protein [Yeosuana sp. MJ-SS3]
MKKTSIIKTVMLIILVTAFVSCGQNASLQSYFVANQETPNFISVDLPVSFVKLDENTLTETQKEAYESMDKLNMLGYHLTENNQEEYKTELQKVQNILKDERYQELFRAGNSKDGKVVVKYIGTDTTIDELILFGNMNDQGFAIIRILGDNMEPAKIMSLSDQIQNINSDENSIGEFMNFFK